MKKLLKKILKYEAITAGIYFLSGSPKTATGSPKTISLSIMLLESFRRTSATKSVSNWTNPLSNNLTIDTKKPVGLIMWDGFYRDYAKDSVKPYDPLINVATKNRVIFSRLKEKGIFKAPFFAVNTAPEVVTVFDNIRYDAATDQNVFDSTNYSVTVDFRYNQSVMDKQISYATQAGFSFLLFNHYANNSPLSQARRDFVASQARGNMKFAYMRPSIGNGSDRNSNIAAMVNEMRLPYYFRIDNKPVLYFEADRLQDFQDLQLAYGSAIYAVLMDSGNNNIPDNIQNFTAGGHYTTFGYNAGSDHSYAGILAEQAAKWQSFLSKNPTAKLCPTLATGFENYTTVNPLSRYSYTNAANDQQLIQGIQALRNQLQSPNCDFGVVYAANEFTECGRCVFPTLNQDGSLNDSTLRIFQQYL